LLVVLIDFGNLGLCSDFAAVDLVVVFAMMVGNVEYMPVVMVAFVVDSASVVQIRCIGYVQVCFSFL
jgi:hypothetical protein